MPWSIDAVLRLPFLPKQSQSLAEFAYKQVMRRLKEGAIHDDVFYHLVRAATVHVCDMHLPAFWIPFVIAE